MIRDRGGFWAPYLTFITICVSYASVAGCLVSFGAPLAAGSGIPEVKTYLNGVHIKGECSGSPHHVIGCSMIDSHWLGRSRGLSPVQWRAYRRQLVPVSHI